MQGSAGRIIPVFISAVLGVIFLACSPSRWFIHRTNKIVTVLLFIGACMLIAGNIALTILSLLMIAGCYIYQKRFYKGEEYESEKI